MTVDDETIKNWIDKLSPEEYEDIMKIVNRSLDTFNQASEVGPYTKYLWDRMMGRTNVTMEEFLKNVIPNG
jgi:hypothetical protein